MMNKSKIAILFFSICLIVLACSKDKFEQDCNINEDITYESHIKPILDTKCATAGCHATGFTIPDYSTYQAMKSSLDGGSFEDRVIIRRDMPEIGSPPLDSIEYELINCWIFQGFPETE